MRAFLLIFTCFLVVGIVLFAMMQAPAPRKPVLEVSRIDSSQRPVPVMQSDPAAEHILDSFPEPTKSPSISTIDEGAENPTVAPVVANPSAPKKAQNEDLNRLLALIDDWIYVDYSQIGSLNKTGTIRKTRENELIGVFEGKELENGIKVAKLTDDVCLLQLGSDTFPLRRVEEPSFFQEVKEKMRPLTVEEQEKAYEYYMRRYGDKFKAYSAMYEPPYGTQNPQRVTSEEKQRGLQEYFERYGKQFQKEAQQNTTPFPYTEQQKENYKKYWQTFFPDRPMPAFDELFQKNNPLEPGSRIETDGQAQTQ